ncbi:MAG: bifunctional phosphopantothenoylcysteine decarboxylase/phosphopantothenate--cysteine ligase CoaBC, partial [Burkholderiales bacterium]|nr:bifunctional phosphopantothenoylcysteine decarboxylase/phosphopantothenate--cysteine ligase CoaBC [Burkholderiales bacterium]
MTESPSKHVLLGVTGGIAAYKTAELTRLLVKAGIDVQVVMTKAATQFVTPVTFQALSGKPVFTDQWDNRVTNNMAHIELTRAADVMLIAPASADFIAKLAQGFADDLLSTACLARDCPLMVAPAMNRQMWEAPSTQRNVAQLRQDGVAVLGPDSGEQACGEVGDGRMVEPQALLEAVSIFFQPKTLANKKVIVTAGPTFEAIDPVRGLTNLSSGKMGYAMAQAAQEAGATVTLVSGPTSLNTPKGVTRIDVVSAAEMLAAVEQALPGSDIFIGVAAVADYTPAQSSNKKMKKGDAALALELIPTVDILAHVASLTDGPFCVGFAAESEDLLENAEAKRQKKNIP